MVFLEGKSFAIRITKDKKEQQQKQAIRNFIVMNNKILSFRDLDCWKACREVSTWVADLVKEFPSSERFALKENLLRAARSTTRNIAEGYGRYSFKDNIRFCRISRGSLYEVLDDLITAKDAGYISDEAFKEGVEKVEKALMVLNGYIKYLSKKINVS